MIHNPKDPKQCKGITYLGRRCKRKALICGYCYWCYEPDEANKELIK